MGDDIFFTQCKKTILIRRKQLFLLVGMLPILLFFVFWTWISSVGHIRFGFGPEKIVFLMPAVMAFQMILLAIKLHGLRLIDLKLSTDAIELHAMDEVRRHLLHDLRKIRVGRDPDGTVNRIILRFGVHSVRLSGYLEMGILHEMLIRYANAGTEGQLRIIDSVR